jgi:hypothetical protein
MMPETPGSDSDEPSPAGTASRSDQPLSPADVLHVSGIGIASTLFGAERQTVSRTQICVRLKSLINKTKHAKQKSSRRHEIIAATKMTPALGFDSQNSPHFPLFHGIFPCQRGSDGGRKSDDIICTHSDFRRPQ